MNLRAQIACVEREIGMRQRVYPGLVDRHKMSQRDADREMETMLAVRNTLRRCEQLAKSLYEGPPYELALKIAAQLRGETAQEALHDEQSRGSRR